MNDFKAKKIQASRKAARAVNNKIFASMDVQSTEQVFAKRGFSSETIKALGAHGILMPEELLFMPFEQVDHIPVGLTKAAKAEIRAYRMRFLGDEH